MIVHRPSLNKIKFSLGKLYLRTETQFQPKISCTIDTICNTLIRRINSIFSSGFKVVHKDLIVHVVSFIANLWLEQGQYFNTVHSVRKSRYEIDEEIVKYPDIFA